MAGAKYKAFISYSHADTRWGTWLHRALEAYKTPASLVGLKNDVGEPIAARLGKVFRDRDELTSGASLDEAIRLALAASEHFIVICSPSAARSRYVNEEILEFKRLDRPNRIHALIVAGEPYASQTSAAEECLPPALRYVVDERGQLTDRPAPEVLAADVRPGKDEKGRALIKLIAGLLHVDFDALYQRERRRRRVRMAALSAAGTAIALALGILGLVALQRSRDASRQQLISAHEAYATALELAESARRAGDHERALEQLKRQRATAGSPDLREFTWRYLSHLYSSHRYGIRVFGQTTSIDLSPDGKMLAIATDSSLVTTWDVETGRSIARMEDRRERFRTALFAAGGKLAAGGSNTDLRIWSLANPGAPAKILGGRFLPSRSRDRRLLLADGSASSLIDLVDVESERVTHVDSNRHVFSVTAYALSTDGRALAIGSGQNTVQVVDTSTRRVTHSRDLPAEFRLQDLSFLSDGALILAGLTRKGAYELLVWDLATNKDGPRLHGPEEALGRLVSISSSPRSDRVAMLAGDPRIAAPVQHSLLTVWDRRSGRQLYALSEQETGFISAMAFSPTADILATGSRDHQVRVWDAATGARRRVLGIHNDDMSESPAEREHRPEGMLASTSRTQNAGISHLLFSSDGRTLVTASGVYPTVLVWDVIDDSDTLDLPVQSAFHTAVAFSPTDATVVSGGRAGEIAVHDAAKGAQSASSPGHQSPVLGLAFSSTGQLLASASHDGTVRVWRMSPLAESQTLGGAAGATVALTFTNDRLVHLTKRGAFEGIAAATRPATFDLRSWPLAAKTTPVALTTVADIATLSPDGTQLAAFAGSDGRGSCGVRTWDLVSGRSAVLPLGTIPCTSLAIMQLAWSPDARLLAIGGPAVADDARARQNVFSGLRVFEMASGRERARLPLPITHFTTGVLKGLAFSPDGRILAAVSARAAESDSTLVAMPERAILSVWSADTFEKKAVYDLPADKCQGAMGVSCVRVGPFTADSSSLSLILSAPPPQSGGSEVILMHLRDGHQVRFPLEVRIDAVAISRSTDRLATVLSRIGAEPAILWNRSDGREVAALGRYDDTIVAVHEAANGHVLAETNTWLPGGGALASLWDVTARNLVVSVSDTAGRSARLLDVSADGQLVADMRNDRQVTIRPVAGAQPAQTIDVAEALGGDGAIQHAPSPIGRIGVVEWLAARVLLSRDGRSLATLGKSKTILWDGAGRKVRYTIEGTEPAAFSPGGGMFAATNDCKTIVLLDVRSGRRPARIATPEGCPTSISLSPDGTILLAIRSYSNGFGSSAYAKLWRVGEREAFATLRGYAGYDGYSAAAFSPDGKTIAATGAESDITLWDAHTGRRVLTLTGPTTVRATSVRFSNDGLRLMASYGRTVRVWHTAR